MMSYYDLEKMSEHRRGELERRLTEKARLRDAGLATSTPIRVMAARALMALAHRLDPHLAALQARQSELAHPSGC
ncbi:hypothetical protein HRbin26_02172 [bacterium HR26]|nr:hypothetical protein HRbin26_02172 [bacterium HR26]